MSAQETVEGFVEGYGFPLDPFQEQGVAALESGRSVLVAAPTGAGKTVVGEFACHLAVTTGTKAFYTTPIKALSNQKYRDLVGRYGADSVGLLTGDRSINGEAPVVVMTTEVLRNMIYERSRTLRQLRYVVLDEVHYLADRSRGAVWEEVIVQLPAIVQIAALSATVSNAEEFGDWLATVRDGGCEVVIEESRPVPLRHHYFVNETVHPTFVSTRRGKQHREHRDRAAQALAGVPNPKVLTMERHAGQRGRTRGGKRLGPPVRLRYPSRPQVVQELADRRWLPAIVFVFSRNGCEQAVEQILAGGVRLTSPAERERVDRIVERAVAGVSEDDLEVLGFGGWLDGLRRGVAAHHAGMVPAFKEAVETAFQEGILKVVVATETLALGINMPAKSVVIERLEKWDGERHVMLTPGEYTQLTGRAGRRGIDRVGHAVVLYQRDIDFRNVAGLVGTRAYPLTSSFAPSYNMAVNLLRNHDLDRAERLLTASFAQFQADRSVSGLARRLEELQTGIDGYAPNLHCDRGDWEDYWRSRRELAEIEARTGRRRRSQREDAVNDRLSRLVPGEVVHWPGGPRRGLAAVVGTSLTNRGKVLARVVTEDRRLQRLGTRELDRPPEVVAMVDLPPVGTPRQPAFRGEVADLLRGLPDPPPRPAEDDAGVPEEVLASRRDVASHPCHDCPERETHELWQQRTDELAEEAHRLRRHINRQTGSLVRQLHQLIGVLRELGYLDDGPAPTSDGMRLARIYTDVDLIVAEALRAGALDGLGPEELAGIAALFTYESRSDDPPVLRDIPTPALRSAITTAMEVADDVRAREQAAGLRPLRELDPGFVGPAWRWASGSDLDGALGSAEMAGGDFVRSMKQVVDLVGQFREAGGPQVVERAGEATELLRRGVVVA